MFEPIDKKRITDRIYDQILELIISKKIKAGEKYHLKIK